MATRTTKTVPKKVNDSKKDEMIPITLRVARPIYDALRGYKRDMGMSSEQDVIRVASATMMIREGYLERSSD